jgi:hypothetical protein
MADGAVGHAELVGGAGETLQTRGRLEGSQGLKGRKVPIRCHGEKGSTKDEK